MDKATASVDLETDGLIHKILLFLPPMERKELEDMLPPSKFLGLENHVSTEI